MNDSMSKNKKLLLGLLFDACGYISYVFPPFDFLWAPLSAYLMTKLYSGTKGKVAATISFIEEAIPFIDFIPSFTLMWIYTYVFSKEENKEKIIEIKQ
jgi:hypothetical protein